MDFVKEKRKKEGISLRASKKPFQIFFKKIIHQGSIVTKVFFKGALSCLRQLKAF